MREVVAGRGHAVFAAGSTQNVGTGFAFTAIGLDPTDGAEIWRTTIDGRGADDAHSLAVSDVGRVFVVGGTTNPETGSDLAVAQLNDQTGSIEWVRQIDGTRRDLPATDVAASVALDNLGRPIVTGVLDNADTGFDIGTVRLRASDGRDLNLLSCPGDCDESNTLTVEELQGGAMISLGEVDLGTCVAMDGSDDSVVTVDELTAAANAALHGCGSTNPSTFEGKRG